MSRNLGELAKKKLQEFVPEIDARIAKYFDEEIKKNFGFNTRQKEVVRQALEHANEYILRPTKRLRGSFVFYGFILGGEKPNEKVWRAAVGVELVHAALLMHDDIQDRDDYRRLGLATHKYYEKLMSNSHLGEAMGINLGDALLCLGFEAIANCNNNEATLQMLRGIVNTGWGQSYDATLENFKKWTEDDVIVLHRAKTGIYTYENPLLVGAYLAGLKEEVVDVLRKYAEDGGVAFQLQDDILGVFGSPEKTGKSADSDLKQGKCTLMVLKAWDRPEVQKVWGKIDASREELNSAKRAIMDCGAHEYNKKLAVEYAARAAKTAEKLRKLELNPEAVDYIQGIAEYMVERDV